MTDTLELAELDRRAEEELAAAARANDPDVRKHHLDEAAAYAHKFEQSRRYQHRLIHRAGGVAEPVVQALKLDGRMRGTVEATQNRDGAALQTKIDELIKHSGGARDVLIGLENRSSEEIEAVREGHGLGCDPEPLPSVTGR